MEYENENKYHGYLILSRQLKHLRKELGTNLFQFYTDLALMARWSRKDKKTFCKIMLTQDEVAEELGIDQSTVSKKLGALKTKHKDSFTKTKRSITLGFLPIFLYDVASKMHSNDYANWNEVYVDMHRINAELQEKYDKTHNRGAQKDPLSINTSSKVSVSLNSNNEEYIDIDEVDRGIEKMVRERKEEEEKNKERLYENEY